MQTREHLSESIVKHDIVALSRIPWWACKS